MVPVLPSAPLPSPLSCSQGPSSATRGARGPLPLGAVPQSHCSQEGQRADALTSGKATEVPTTSRFTWGTGGNSFPCSEHLRGKKSNEGVRTLAA